MLFERFSDSAGGFIVLDPKNAAVFKTLLRAAKAKLKLRLKATVTSIPTVQAEASPAPKQEVVTSAAMEPVIVRSSPSSRDSTALDRRSMGSGIFQFREARASQQTLVNEEATSDPFRGAEPAYTITQPQLASITLPIRNQTVQSTTIINNQGRPWSVYCNECDQPIGDGHFHCSICDGGDYDLCENCVSGGKLCPGEGHWLIKRFIKDGKVISSSTERILPRGARLPQPMKAEAPKPVPGAFTTSAEECTHNSHTRNLATRTCNNCVVVLHEDSFVTCTACDDFDLCLPCHEENKHGHHPAHGFDRATDGTRLSMLATSQLAPGRNVRHDATCDGCNAPIYGIRHKCLNCPDWDFCNECIKGAATTHPRHRFAPLYDTIGLAPQLVRHFGIYCDGPLCKDNEHQSYIRGNRYKCAVCHDTDFCANCEAHPGNHHNRTHPLIMFKTPVKNVNVSTENQDVSGNVRVMGDRHAMPGAPIKGAGLQVPPPPQMETTKCQTVADIKPFVEEKKNIINIPVQGPKDSTSGPVVLNAHFRQDSIADGTSMVAGNCFTQIWTLRNPGPHAWPAGCSVRYVGGDNMLNIDNAHPVPSAGVASATESNIVGREVHVGEDIAFKVALKAPQRVGRAISYWRLKSPDGTPFGHRLWCDINVKKAEPEQPSQSAHMTTADEFDRELNLHLERKMSARLGSPPQYNLLSPEKRRMAEHLKERQRAALMAYRNLPPPSLPEEKDFSKEIICTPDFEGARARGVAAIMGKERMEAIKAKILKSREERAKNMEAQGAGLAQGDGLARATALLAQYPLTDRALRNSIPIKGESSFENSVKHEVAQDGGLMVFPRLDKESPESSTYQSATSSSGKGKAAWVEDEDGEVEGTASRPASISQPPATTPTGDDFEDVTDEIEVLSAGSEESDDDGFLTDEEYDILDASDRETVASP